MDKYTQHLAAAVINDQQIVSYRQLSRALKVHVNTAKQMLYSFHKVSNGKRPGQVHATYQIIGTRPPLRYSSANGSNSQQTDEMDVDHNPFQSSAPEHEPPEVDDEVIPVTAIILVAEEDLEAAKETFEEIHTIFVYSVEPNRPQDLQVLSNCNAEVRRKHGNEDPLKRWEIYGSIHDPNCKTRSTKRPPPPPAPAAPAPATSSKPAAAKAATQLKPTAKAAETRKPGAHSTSAAITTDKKAPAKPVPALKRQSSSNIANAFKSQPKPKQRKPSAVSTPAESQPTEDEEMADPVESEDEGDDEDFPAVATKAKSEEARKARQEREAKLRAMMEEEDEPMVDAPTPAAETPEEELEAAPKAKEVPAGTESDVQVGNGRRRGRRRVTKKKTVKDEEGYLVTKEELVWESFSEDEPEPAPTNKRAKATASKEAPAAKKKAAGKPGQGNIMSFFSKK